MLRARPSITRLAAAVLVGALLVGCPFVDYFPRRPLKNVSESQVVGKWKLTKSHPPAAWAEDATAEFHADGTCSLHKFAHGDDETSGSYGWRIDLEDGSKASVLYITGFGTPQHPLTISFRFTRKHGKLVLWQYVGDPDSGNYIEYERI
jgi:hypothetical protein